MRSRILLAGAGFLVFAVAVTAGFYLAFQLAPQRLRAAVESQLAEATGAAVRIGRLDFRWIEEAPWLEAVGEGITLGPDADGRRLDLGRVEAPIDLLQLFLGRVDASALRIESAEILWPGAEADPSDPFAELRALGAALRDEPCPWVPMQLQGVSLRAEPDEDPLILDVNGWLDCGRLPRRGELVLSGRVPALGEGSEVERLRIVSGSDHVEAWASMRQVALGQVLDSDWSGDADLEASWRSERGEPERFEASVRGRKVALTLRDANETLRTGNALLEIEAEAAQDRLVLQSARLRQAGHPDLALQGHARLPIAWSSDLVLEVRSASVSLVSPPDWIRAVGRLLARFTEPIQFVETGSVRDVRLEARTTFRGLERLLRGDVLARPGELTVELSVDQATLGRAADGSVALSDLSGRARFEHDRLELSDVRASYLGQPLPRADLVVTGFSHLRGFDELNCVRPAPGLPIDGLERLEQWIESRREPGEPTSWQRLRLEVDWINHPTLLCSVEHLIGEIEPLKGGFQIAVESGVWAGLPVQIAAKLIEEPDAVGLEAIEAQVSVGPPFEGMHPNPPTEPWASGRFEVEAHSLGDWRIRGADGRFEIRGAEVHLHKTRLQLDPGGVVNAEIFVDVGRDGPLPFRAEAKVPTTEVAPFLEAAGATQTLLTGRIDAEGSVEGVLDLGLPPLARARGSLVVRAQDGEIHRRLPILLAIAVASDRFNPFGSRDRIRYDTIDLDARVEDGEVHSDLFRLDAPSLRMAATGHIQVVEPHGIEAVSGVFFFPGLDSLIRRIPVVNRVILGRNDNLVGAYFSLSGPWRDPRASIVPVKSLASAGPAEVLLLDIPGFVWGGIKRIQSVLTPIPDDRPETRAKEAG